MNEERNIREKFRRIAGEDLELDAYELKAMLNNEFAKGRAGWGRVGGVGGRGGVGVGGWVGGVGEAGGGPRAGCLRAQGHAQQRVRQR